MTTKLELNMLQLQEAVNDKALPLLTRSSWRKSDLEYMEAVAEMQAILVELDIFYREEYNLGERS